MLDVDLSEYPAWLRLEMQKENPTPEDLQAAYETGLACSRTPCLLFDKHQPPAGVYIWTCLRAGLERVPLLDFPFLSVLDISHNQITEFPTELPAGLRIFRASHNRLRSLQGKHPQLEELDVSYNCLESWGPIDQNTEFSQLKVLKMAHNPDFQGVSGIHRVFPQLRSLDLSGIPWSTLAQLLDLRPCRLTALEVDLRWSDLGAPNDALRYPLMRVFPGYPPRTQVLATVPFLASLNGEPVSPEDKGSVGALLDEIHQLTL